jgi:hypothetical protein
MKKSYSSYNPKNHSLDLCARGRLGARASAQTRCASSGAGSPLAPDPQPPLGGKGSAQKNKPISSIIKTT